MKETFYKEAHTSLCDYNITAYKGVEKVFSFRPVVYACCSRHIRFELQAVLFGKGIDIFVQFNKHPR